MRVIQITPGSGESFYCENCLRDYALVRGLRAAGCDATIVPLYLPLGADAPDVSESEIFFGGINVYLRQKSPFLSRVSGLLRPLLDSRRLLRWAGGLAGMTSARDLATATLSMLRGEQGRQAGELTRLLDWLDANDRPDVVCLSNALLSGLAEPIKRRLGAKICCLLQDEDQFLDAIAEPYRKQAWELVATNLRHVDAVAAVSEWYGSIMRDRLKMDSSRLQVCRAGIDPSEYVSGPAPARPTVGLLSRICRQNGPDLLIEAFAILRRQKGFADARLVLAGGWTTNDKPFIKTLRRRVMELGLGEAVSFLPNIQDKVRRDFLAGLSVLAAPHRQPEACGFFALEAMSCSVPLVLSDCGVFREIIDNTRCGLLVGGEDAAKLADALAAAIGDHDRLGQNGRTAVMGEYSAAAMAARMSEIFSGIGVVAGPPANRS